MRSKYIRPLALLLCAAMLGCLLAACNGSADSSPASSAAPASDSASASGSSEPPSSTTEATGELNPGNPGNLTRTRCSPSPARKTPLRPVWGLGIRLLFEIGHRGGIAAAMGRGRTDVQPLPGGHSGGLLQLVRRPDRQPAGRLAEAWPLVKDAALDLLSDKDSMTGRIADAGLDADTLPGCTLKKPAGAAKRAGRYQCRRRTARLKNF